MPNRRHGQGVITRLEEAIDEAMARGQTGFKGLAPVLVGQQVLSVVMAGQDTAVSWLINLCAQRYSSGPLPFGANGGPDNTVQTGFFPGSGTLPGSPPESFANVFNLIGPYVRLTWGLGNTLEQAYVDYPFGGCSIQVSGSQVRVELPPVRAAISGNVPNLGGFITPSPAGRQQGRPNTLTTGTVTIIEASTYNFPIPPRARGYRLWTDIAPAAASSVFVVKQCLYNGAITPITYDDDSAWVYQSKPVEAALAVITSGITNAQDTSYQDLDPRATFVQVGNPSATGNQDCGIVWQLDIS